MNIERPTSNVEWEKMKKQTHDLEERLANYCKEAGYQYTSAFSLNG
jgi:hypothetical protein